MPCAKGPHLRIISPSGVGSILITSAPRSARIIEQNGPASARDRSTTRRPSKGSRAVMVLTRLDLDLVRVESEQLLDRQHLVERLLVAPDGVLGAALQRKIRGIALERTMRAVA